MIAVDPIGIVLPCPGTRVAALRLEIRCRKRCREAAEKVSWLGKILRTRKGGRGQVKSKPGVVGNVPAGIPAPCRGKKFRLVVVADYGNLVKRSVDVRPIDDLPVPLESSRDGVMVA